jgi:nucleotide-binding universal stress UspA family protein
MNRILLPTDFSDNTWSSIVYALKLFKDEPCKFFLLNTKEIDVTSLPHLSTDLDESIREKPVKELNELKEQLEMSDQNANHEFYVIFKMDGLANAVKTVVADFDINLVVMATRGASGAKGFFFGSNTISVVNRLKECPVLIIPEEFDYVQPKQIAFPSDFNRFYKNKEIEPLTDIAELYNSSIRIAHIHTEKTLNEVQEYNLETLKEYLDGFEVSIHWIPDFAKKSEAINVFIEELDIDILVMVKYGHSFIERIIKEPVIKKIGFHPVIPFLVIPAR